MNKFGFLVALGVILASSSAADVTVCNGVDEYDYPSTDSCWKYAHCNKGTTIPEGGWCFPLMRRFSRKENKCDWFWKVDCTEKPTNPPPPPSQAPTQSPPTQPPTQPPTEPPTEPPTKPPTPNEPPTQPPTEPPTQPPTEPPTQPSTKPPTQPPTKPPKSDETIADKLFHAIRGREFHISNPIKGQITTEKL